MIKFNPMFFTKKISNLCFYPNICLSWIQSYDFLIYSYNASVEVGYSVFQRRIKYLCFQDVLAYPWRCKNLQR
jgi:hypothetical protein